MIDLKMRISTLIIVLVMVILAASIAISGLLNFSHTHDAYNTQIKPDYLRNYISRVGSNLKLQAGQALEISRAMAHNPLFIEWLQGQEQDERLGRLALQTLDAIKHDLGYFTTFLVSRQTHNYWREGHQRLEVVSPDDPDDDWFFQAINSDRPVSFNLDHNKELNGTFLFVNAVIKADAEVLGVTGVGLRLDDLIASIETALTLPATHVSLIDQQGKILVSNDTAMIGQAVTAILGIELQALADPPTIHYTWHGQREYAVVSEPLLASQYRIVLAVPHQALTGFIDRIRFNMIGTLSVTTVIAVTLLFLLVRYMLQREAAQRLNQENDRLRGEVERRERAEQKLRDLLYFDPVTQLPKVAALGAVLPERPQPHGQDHVIALSIENVRRLSSILETDLIDQALRRAGHILQALLQPVGGTVVRTRGFSLLGLYSCTDAEAAKALAARVNEAFRSPVELSEHRVRLRVRIGVAAYGPADSLAKALDKADIALGNARASVNSRISFFHPESRRQAARIVQLETAMSSANFLNELQLYYQPIVELGSGRIAGFEALLRWHSPEHGAISPAQFVPLAEENGTIIEIGRFVLRTACAFVPQLLATAQQPLFISVNVSPVQLLEFEVVESFAGIIQDAGVSPAALKLEITETAIEEEETEIWRIIEAFRQVGLGIAIDDFGAGTAAFRRLNTLDFDWLKIDRALVAQVEHDPKARRLFASIAQMSQALGANTVVEGIENSEQRDFAASLGITLAQGYWFARPLPPAAALALARDLRQQRNPLDFWQAQHQ